MSKVFVFAVVAVSVVSSVSVFSMKEVPDFERRDVVLANIEALSENESNTGRPNICYKVLEGYQGAPMEDKTWCTDCKPRPALK